MASYHPGLTFLLRGHHPIYAQSPPSGLFSGPFVPSDSGAHQGALPALITELREKTGMLKLLGMAAVVPAAPGFPPAAFPETTWKPAPRRIRSRAMAWAKPGATVPAAAVFWGRSTCRRSRQAQSFITGGSGLWRSHSWLVPLSFGEIDILHRLWGGQSCPQAGLPAGWTRWKAGPQAEKPAPQGKLSGKSIPTLCPIEIPIHADESCSRRELAGRRAHGLWETAVKMPRDEEPRAAAKSGCATSYGRSPKS